MSSISRPDRQSYWSMYRANQQLEKTADAAKPEFELTVGSVTGDLLAGAVGGLAEGAESIANLGATLSNLVTGYDYKFTFAQSVWDMMGKEEGAETILGSITAGIAQFLTPYGFVGKAGRALSLADKSRKVGKTAQSMKLRSQADELSKVGKLEEATALIGKAEKLELAPAYGPIRRGVGFVGDLLAGRGFTTLNTKPGYLRPLRRPGRELNMLMAGGASKGEFLKYQMLHAVYQAPRSAVADAIAWDENEARFADLLATIPGMENNPITGLLGYDETDSEAEFRIKNAFEGALFGAPLDFAVGWLVSSRAAGKALAAGADEDTARAVGLQRLYDFNVETRQREQAELDAKADEIANGERTQLWPLDALEDKATGKRWKETEEAQQWIEAFKEGRVNEDGSVVSRQVKRQLEEERGAALGVRGPVTGEQALDLLDRMEPEERFEFLRKETESLLEAHRAADREAIGRGGGKTADERINARAAEIAGDVENMTPKQRRNALRKGRAQARRELIAELDDQEAAARLQKREEIIGVIDDKIQALKEAALDKGADVNEVAKEAEELFKQADAIDEPDIVVTRPAGLPEGSKVVAGPDGAPSLEISGSAFRKNAEEVAEDLTQNIQSILLSSGRTADTPPDPNDILRAVDEMLSRTDMVDNPRQLGPDGKPIPIPADHGRKFANMQKIKRLMETEDGYTEIVRALEITFGRGLRGATLDREQLAQHTLNILTSVKDMPEADKMAFLEGMAQASEEELITATIKTQTLGAVAHLYQQRLARLTRELRQAEDTVDHQGLATLSRLWDTWTTARESYTRNMSLGGFFLSNPVMQLDEVQARAVNLGRNVCGLKPS